MSENCNVLLMVLDSVRAANTSLYGYENETTPYLNAFVREEDVTLFERAWAPSSWSLPSHVSMFTGYEAEEHGITDSTDRLDPKESIYYELGEKGYETGVFSENPWIAGMDVGVKEGFDTVEIGASLPFPNALNPSLFSMEKGDSAVEYFKSCLRHDHPVGSVINGGAVKLRNDFPRLAPSWLFNEPSAEDYTESFLTWMRNEVDGSWAACVNFMDAHMPYTPKERHNLWGDDTLRKMQQQMDDAVWEFYDDDKKWWRRKALEALYDGSILEVDANVQRIIESLKQNGAYENTLIVITADHGEGFGEPSRVSDRRVSGHGRSVHENLLRVPLIVKEPNQTEGERVSSLASLRGFAEAARRAVNGSDATTAFEQETVLSSYNGMSAPTRAIAKEHVDDMDAHDAVGRAVYTEGSDSVRKIASWGDQAAEIRVRDAQTAWREQEIDVGEVNAFFEALDDANVNVGAEEQGEVDDAVERRLEDLGYR